MEHGGPSPLVVHADAEEALIATNSSSVGQLPKALVRSCGVAPEHSRIWRILHLQVKSKL